ncbi:hypothetical protein AAMO2058_001336500 [Amorphochlora amoebiformis]
MIVLQVGSTGYFGMLDMPVKYDIDIKLLENRYKKLQQDHHPDQFANKPKDEFERAVSMSSSINEAYETLKHPLHRARYMLEIGGVCMAEGHIIHNEQFLSKIMEMQERVEAASEQKEILGLFQEVEDLYVDCVEELSEAFAQGTSINQHTYIIQPSTNTYIIQCYA